MKEIIEKLLLVVIVIIFFLTGCATTNSPLIKASSEGDYQKGKACDKS